MASRAINADMTRAQVLNMRVDRKPLTLIQDEPLTLIDTSPPPSIRQTETNSLQLLEEVYRLEKLITEIEADWRQQDNIAEHNAVARRISAAADRLLSLVKQNVALLN
jgi:hypothetical protein